ISINPFPAMFIDTPTGFAMHRVASRDDWTRVRALRYEALAHRGDLAQEIEPSYADPHDLALNTSTFLLTRNGRAIGSTRASQSAPNRRGALPAMDAFAREVEAIGLECTVVEASLSVVDPATSADPRMVLFHLLKAQMLSCATQRADWLLASVRETE